MNLLAKNRNGEKKLTVTKGRKGSGTNGEIRTGIYTPLCIK